MNEADERDLSTVRAAGVGLMLILVPIVVGLLYLNGTNFDPRRIIGCYHAPGVPLIQITLNELRADQSGFKPRRIAIEEQKQGYGFHLDPGLELGGDAGRFRLQDSTQRNWVTVDTRRNGGTMTLSLEEYRGEIDLRKVPCPNWK